MQPCCCDQGFSGLARHRALSPVLGFSITTSRAQPSTESPAMKRRRPPSIETPLPARALAGPVDTSAYSRPSEGELGEAAAWRGGRFHHPPPRLWNRNTVSEKRAL